MTYGEVARKATFLRSRALNSAARVRGGFSLACERRSWLYRFAAWRLSMAQALFGPTRHPCPFGVGTGLWATRAALEKLGKAMRDFGGEPPTRSEP